MGFDDGFHDRQAHAGTLYPVSLILATIKLVEDQSLFHVVDTYTLVGDGELKIRLRPVAVRR